MLPDEGPSAEQIEVLRRMTPEQRWRTAHRLYWTARRYKAAYIRSQHPDWPESTVEAKVREIFSNVQIVYDSEGLIPTVVYVEPVSPSMT
jgi:hypothetical protein